MALMNDRRSVFLVLGLARESELVLGFAIGDLVNAIERGREKTSVKRGSWYKEYAATHRNHSFVARTRPGRWRSTSSISFSLDASGS